MPVSNPCQGCAVSRKPKVRYTVEVRRTESFHARRALA